MRRRKNAGNILIDLTSLLDVVFIVLLALVCQLQTSKQANAQTTQDLEDQRAQITATQEQYKDQLDSMGNIADYVVFISVNARFESNLMTRHIEVLCSDSEAPEAEIAVLNGENVSEGYAGLSDYIQDYVQDNEDKTVVLSLNEGDEDILYRDEKEIKHIFTELATEYSNVKIKEGY